MNWKKMKKFQLHLDGKPQSLFSRRSVPPFQKQPFAYVVQINRFLKKRNIHRKTPALESLFNKVLVLQVYNLIKRKLQQRCFPVNIAKFLRTPFFIEHLRWLLLPFTTSFWNYYWKKRLVILFTLTHPNKRLNTCSKTDVRKCTPRQ